MGRGFKMITDWISVSVWVMAFMLSFGLLVILKDLGVMVRCLPSHIIVGFFAFCVGLLMANVLIRDILLRGIN